MVNLNLASGSPKKILIIENNAIAARSLMRNLRFLSDQIEIVSVIDEEQLKNETWDILVIGFDNFSEDERKKIITYQSSSNNSEKSFFLSSDNSRKDFSDLLLLSSLQHFSYRGSETDAEDLSCNIQKIFRRDIFGIEKYFPWGTKFLSISLDVSKEKENFLNIAGDFVSNIGLPSRMQSTFCNVVDELTTNAFCGSPESIASESHQKTVDVTFCCDGRRVGVSVRESFGEITENIIRSQLKDGLKKSIEAQKLSIEDNNFGLYYSFNSLSQLIFNIIPKQKTETIGILDLRATYKDFISKGKCFHIFSVSEDPSINKSDSLASK